MADEVGCPKCGSTVVIPGVSVVDYGHSNAKRSLKVEVHENPDAWFFKGTRQGVLKAMICGQCGFTELYVTNPQELLEAYRKQPRDPATSE